MVLDLMHVKVGKIAMIFSADMSSSVHIDNKKKDILIPGKGPTDALDDTTLTAEKEYSISFTEQQKKSWLRLHYDISNSNIFVNSDETNNFKSKDSEINAALLCLCNV